MSKKTKKQLESELTQAIHRAESAEALRGTRIDNTTVGGMSPLHAEGIMKLAEAALANAKAIEAIATKARVEIHGHGIYIEAPSR